ncbi:hypothetical protein [Alkaliphilus oremlandii]|uniref:Uncharacterized protein n=1 Tax=Alkaliphilus oremlandii (strain OhILAs) TaxID=350688 RepID=A8MLR9_ALKOO|nr:hypothetical protein [Alkaliphilus oremlandii]ABW17986.1 conserved hypothetical protein [Alkaliphilus oremlandii OhILAs]
MNKKSRLILSVFMIVTMILSLNITVFAEELVTDKIKAETIEIQILNSEDFSETPIPGMELENSNFRANNTIVPFLIRSGNTEEVEVYIHYAGTKMANAVRFKSLTLKECNLVLPEKTYKTFKPAPPYLYSTHTFPAGIIGSVKIGDILVPTNKSSVKVNTSDLQVFYMTEGWNSYSNIVGCWTLN